MESAKLVFGSCDQRGSIQCSIHRRPWQLHAAGPNPTVVILRALVLETS